MEITKKYTNKFQELGMKFFNSRSDKDFSKLFNGMRKPLYRYIERYGLEYDDVSDIIANISVSIYYKIDTYDINWNFSTWVFSIAKNQTLTFIRNKNKKVINLDFTKAPVKLQNKFTENCIETAIIRNETIERVKKMMDILNPTQQEIFTEKYYNELTYDEISDKLDIPLYKVKNVLFTGKKKLKELYFEETL